MSWNFWKKDKPVEKTKKELIRESLMNVAYSSDALKQSEIKLHDAYSMVCFVNDDFPAEKQTLHASEACSDYLFYASNQPDAVQWMERQKLTAKRDKIVLYMLPAEHMQDLYAVHVKNRKEGKPSPFKTISVIIYNGKAYPVAFCLGFLWGSQTVNYNEYPSTRI